MANRDQYDPEQKKIVLADREIAKRLDKLEREPYKDLLKQAQAEFQVAYDHQYSKKAENLLRLKLFNNQRRDKDAVGDVTMFATHQTVMAALYTDQLIPSFVGREEGDEETADSLVQVATFDTDEMQLDVVDYDWIWDTCGFGRGLLDMSTFIRDPEKGIFVPAPRVWDPATFLRDPAASSVNGNNLLGENGARFFGREIKMSKWAMQQNHHFFRDINWDEMRFGTSNNSLSEQSAQARADAQGYSFANQSRGIESKLGANGQYDLVEWYTHHIDDNGQLVKCRLWMANKRQKMVGYEKLGTYEKKWKLIDRALYPTSHEWDGTSIWDLTEDKQRFRALAQNLGLKAMIADVYPMYAFDSSKIKNKKDLKFGYNKFIGGEGNPNNLIAPIHKAQPNLALLEFIYTSLDRSAQIANATPEVKQGVQTEQARTLGENNLVAGGADTRYSLSAKIFGISERNRWSAWYQSYKENFAEGIDKKSIRITGAFGTKWRGLTKENFITETDPDVQIESKVISRAKQLEERQSLGAFMTLAFQDPTTNKRYGLKRLGKVYGMTKDEMDRLFPPTIDEMQAEDENDLLNENKPVQVFAAQDHNTHIEIHAKAKDSVARDHHIEAHKKALMVKKMRPELFPAPQEQANTGMNAAGGSVATTQPTPMTPTAPSATSGQTA